MTLVESFQKNLRSARLRAKLTQEQVAAKAGLSVSMISMLERGRRSPPLDTLEAVAGAIGVPATTLLRAA